MRAMVLLAADTSTTRGSVALKVPDSKVMERDLPEGLPHSETLLPAIQELLAASGLGPKDVTALAVGVGPGAFTGLRVGLSTFKGLAFTSRLPLAPVPSLDAVAYPLLLEGRKALVAADARKGELYAACYSGITPEGLPARDCDVALITHHAFSQFCLRCPAGKRIVAGTGLAMIKGMVDSIPFLAPAGDDMAYPRASFVMEIGQKMLDLGRSVTPSELFPFYVRPPDATPYREAAGPASGNSPGRK